MSLGGVSVVSGCLRTSFGDEETTGRESTEVVEGTEETATVVNTESDTPNQREAENWTQYGFDSSNSGYASGRDGPGRVGGSSSKLINPGDSFAIYDDELFGDGNKYQIPLNSSNRVEIADRMSHTMIHRGRLYMTGTGEDGKVGKVGAFELDGTQIWSRTFQPGDDGRSFPMWSPAAAGDTIYQATGDGTFHAIDASTGDTQWKYDLGWQKRLTPAIKNGLIHVPGRETVALSQDGEEKWTRSLEFSSCPTVGDDTVYYFGNIRTKDTQGLFALNATNGSVEWSVDLGPMGYEGLRNIAIDDSKVYVNSNDKMSAVEKSDGRIAWQSQLRRPGEVTVTERHVYGAGRGSSSGGIKAFDKETGEELWSEIINSPIQTEPVISHNSVYIGSYKTYVFSEPQKQT